MTGGTPPAEGTIADPPAKVAAVFDAVPAPARKRLLLIRGLILAAAKATDTAPLTETLKWGQPAYLPVKAAGTTVRLHWSESNADVCQMLVHCQTDLIDRCRTLFPDTFDYDGNRAVRVPVNSPVSQAALQQIAAMALTYHRDKRGARAPLRA